MEIIDHRLVGSLHVDLIDRATAATELAEGAEPAGDAFQTSTIEALLDGAYDGDLTFGELLAHGDLGIGTIDHLDGEAVILDGQAWIVESTGRVRHVADDEKTPFAVVCRFLADTSVAVGPCADMTQVTATIDAAAPESGSVLAVRIDGTFASARVRSVTGQTKPYPPLRDVVAHQKEWDLAEVAGSVVGFRFPDRTSGLEVPGWHLHFLTDDRTAGGHLMELAITSATLHVQTTDALHVEVPDTVIAAAGATGMDRTAEIDAVEGRSPG